MSCYSPEKHILLYGIVDCVAYKVLGMDNKHNQKVSWPYSQVPYDISRNKDFYYE